MDLANNISSLLSFTQSKASRLCFSFEGSAFGDGTDVFVELVLVISSRPAFAITIIWSQGCGCDSGGGGRSKGSKVKRRMLLCRSWPDRRKKVLVDPMSFQDMNHEERSGYDGQSQEA